MNDKNYLTFRHELKYLISQRDCNLLKHRLEEFLERDAHVDGNGQYKVRSLYFDDYWNSAYKEKMMGIMNRAKYRIRIYNDNDKVISLECKLKRGSCIAKKKASLTRKEVYQILDGDYGFLERSDKPLCREFYYECVTRIMRPRVVVDYSREPLVFLPGDVRITFDRYLRAGSMGYDIFDKSLPTLQVMEPDRLVMEVKFTEFLPRLIRQILPPKSSEQAAVSKYIMCCDRRMYLRDRQ